MGASGQTTAIDGFRVVGPLAYRGKAGCENVTCTRLVTRREDGSLDLGDACLGWHCAYCDAPCSSQGHGCDAAAAVLGEARRALGES